MRFKWGAFLAVAVLGWLGAAVLHACWPMVYGEALDTQSGKLITYIAVLDLKRVRVHETDTSASELIRVYPGSAGVKPQLLAFSGCCYYGALPGYIRAKLGLGVHIRDVSINTETDRMSLAMLDSVAMLLVNDEWLRGEVPCGITPEGKAQLMRNMLEVLRRRGESKYVSRTVLPPLMQHLDHPAGPADVPTPRQIIRKGAQLF